MSLGVVRVRKMPKMFHACIIIYVFMYYACMYYLNGPKSLVGGKGRERFRRGKERYF